MFNIDSSVFGVVIPSVSDLSVLPFAVCFAGVIVHSAVGASVLLLTSIPSVALEKGR